MAPHSSTLAWKIPWTEGPGELRSMGSLGVGHDWATSLSLFTFLHWRRKWQPTPGFLPGESQGRRSLVGCRLWGRTESDTTEQLSSSSSSKYISNSAKWWRCRCKLVTVPNLSLQLNRRRQTCKPSKTWVTFLTYCLLGEVTNMQNHLFDTIVRTCGVISLWKDFKTRILNFILLLEMISLSLS